MFHAIIVLTTVLFADGPIPRSKAIPDSTGNTLWFNINVLRIEGKGWKETAKPFDRLPASAESLVRPEVWKLSRNSAGLCARFITDAGYINARWNVSGADLAMNHFAATGVSGIDLYVKMPEGQWRWLGIGRPKSFPVNECYLAQDIIGAQKREYLVYFPLYNGLDSLWLGLPKDAFFSQAPARPANVLPIVFYGTSITQGGCASRPGMAYVSQLGRMLDREVINLGFSGNGRMEPALASFLAELAPALYVIDCLPNLQPDQVTERVAPFVMTLRKARPATPILLVDTPDYQDGFLIKPRMDRVLASRKNLIEEFTKLTADNVSGLFYLNGEKFFGQDGEGTVDGTHPTDLGFKRQTDIMLPVIQGILSRE